ncbi:type II-B CRISPR-associated RNA-guided endonuclease Cas9/Csx12 [Bathymodiolus thermophilus thioautotrophic gill symbiont]|uniref:Type II-B CRISPR-associated RNA-guided endonuclease Cas9/Csx12 n=1 Tax=Bathymodiolus thermophilus thioautotrophic gill symbiont TaxID=2360 RepID=A0A3G3IKC4_9GAMM|nr:type II-B CRISPR-associated RNA-guided endonuclease Cas9/Csx12 [Bathymodiolus thermophilus thioautotrophic gill symbiont]AYQ56296.1 type II-B CRISPR-associated RNA-guided endonuclease Cas9/Csx12 [Bathymodiolus thermophilus thioautotrophic gill symbiont]
MSKIISPIAIDMGAKNTGVYYAHYQRNSTFQEVDKKGQVLVYGNYTPLLVSRTANRHTRRGYTRKKLAKRLLSVVLKEYFDFPAEKHTQALGFLMNRRGFSFLEEEYSKEYLNNLPNDSWEALSEEVQKMLGGQENIADRLMNLATTNPSEVTKLLEAVQNIKGYKDFQEEDKEIKADLVYFDYIEKISKACKLVKKGESIEDDKVTKSKKDKQNLSKTANWVVARLNNENALNLTVATESYQTNLIEEITQINYQQIQNNLPDFEKEREVIKQRKKDNNTSDWKFNYSEFKFNTPNEKGLEEDVARTHLHHFCYAVYKINNEIISGGRHRSKFFDEIKDDLDNFTTNSFLNNKHNPEYLKDFILAINENKGLDVDKLYKLVCHISNFELKPLRKYFNTEAYKSGDKLDNKNLSKITSRWFLQHWIVTKEKDKEAKVEDYEKLKKAWRAHQKCQDDNKNNIISFWLKTDPKLTIPPYQAMLNRHPPKCQSLLLNADYLNKHYPHWEDWLDDLNSNEEYQTKLQSLQRGKGRRKAKNGKEIDGRLLDDEKIKTRQLQFILDTAKKQDFYKLNEIWSVYHKLQKSDVDKIKWQEKLGNLIDASKLPKDLKQDLDFSQEESFGHFLNKYYQTRRKARDGRYFLIQEKKEKWLTNNKLLILCTHKPRQKKHQWQLDLAAVLGVNADDLKAKIVGNPEDYFKSIKGFASNCEKAAKAQKEHRGELKHKIYTELTSNPIDKLGKLANKCSNLKQELIKEIKIPELLADKQTNEVNQKIALVFKFAQIHNIVFKDRSGFSKTCPVCSTDNAFRMQENDKGITKASRLPALSIRLIDGVVMRICDAIARQVAVTKWNDIKDDLQNGTKVSVPLILEQNRFEFEPNLKKIKTAPKPGVKAAEKADEIKDNRTNKYKGQKVSLYSGEGLGSDGEIDHIIPRTGPYGILNDEANLIYISKSDNQNKGNDIKFLKDLHKNYKTEIFGKKSDAEIKEFIYKRLGKDIESKDFAFDKYLSFINLGEKDKKAFRHALFLQEGDPLREKVIRALNNRNRAIVNGTQRYLAQCIADKIHRIAKKENKHNLIEFDYLEYTARWDDPKSTYNLRKKYDLVKSKKQPLYSHLIDAQLAFLLASEDHQNDGTMGIKFDNNQTIWEYETNKETGEISPSKSFNAIDVGESDLKKIDLSPKDSNQKIIDIEKNNSNKKQNLSKIFKRRMFKANAIGERYKPIVKFKDKWYLGYPMTIKGGIYNCDEYCQEVASKNDIKKIEDVVNDDKYYQLTTDHKQIKIWTIKIVDKKYKKINKDSHRYFSQLNPEYNNDEKKEVDQIKFILDKCRYYVAKTDVINAPKIFDKQGYPFYKNWVDFDNAWRKEIGDDYSVKTGEYDLSNNTTKKKWDIFCKNRFSPPENQHKNKHQVKGKKYTMISSGTPSGNVFRVKRNNQNIYQALPLDNNIILKKKSNFLIKHSKNLTLSSAVADKDLAKPIDIEEKIELKNCVIPANNFFKDELKGVKVFLNNTSVDIKDFPLDKFREYFNKEIDVKKSIKIEILTEEQAEIDLTENPNLLYAHKCKVDASIRYTTRDGSVTNIRVGVKERLVSFSLPFRSCEKIYKDSQG